MRIAIVGGGAAGLMAAVSAHETNPAAEIFLLEKNDVFGKKVIISGGGRCNVTTGIHDIRTVLSKYPRGSKFLSSAMYAFSPAAVYDWFETHGVPLNTEEDLRVFPRSNNGKDVVQALEQCLKHAHIHLRPKTHVSRIEKTASGFSLFCKEDPSPLLVEKLILTTGGQAYRHTGSTGDGYAFAMSLGHSITPLAPSLNAFRTAETWVGSVSGLALPSAQITSTRNHRHTAAGPLLFTHTGLTGPAVFALSAHVAFESYDTDHPLEITLDLFPHANTEEVKTTLQELITKNPKKSIVNTLDILMARSLAEALCVELHIPTDKHACEINKKDLIRIITWTKGIPFHVIARGAGDEFVTAGGIPLTEVDPKTLASKKCPGLFFAGEILDIDGVTGGFNLQASWATGHAAGKSAALA